MASKSHNAEGTFLTLELLFVFAGNQLIAQDMRKDDEQSQCSKTKPDNIKVFSRALFKHMQLFVG